MSKEKVDAYKAKKANRKAELEAEKRKKARSKAISKIVGGVVALGIAVALVFTGINGVNSYKASQPNYDREECVIYDYSGVEATMTEQAAE